MSITEVQARIGELRSRFDELSPRAALSVAPAPEVSSPELGSPGVGGPSSGAAPSPFATALEQAIGRTAATAPAPTGASSGASGAVPDGDLTTKVIASARSQLGVPYRWGGTTPAGFDCSGFLQYVFAQNGITLPRTSADQARAGVAVSPADAQPGDLVAMDNSRARAGVDHIGMYLGNGQWIAAPHTGDVVRVQNVDLSKAVAIRRVLPAASPHTAAQPAAALSATVPATGWAAQLPAAARPYTDLIAKASQATGVDPRLLTAVAWTESGFSPTARSGAGAIGLMQLMPGTARGLGVDPTNPAQALLGGARYLKDNLTAFGGRVDLALAAYNAGPTAVQRYGGVPPYAETQAYVRQVTQRYQQLGGQL